MKIRFGFGAWSRDASGMPQVLGPWQQEAAGGIDRQHDDEAAKSTKQAPSRYIAASRLQGHSCNRLFISYCLLLLIGY